MNMAHAISAGLFVFAVAGALPAAEPASGAEASAKVLATEVCTFCHGPGGHSTMPATPNLAAQTWPYLSAKLKIFRSRASAKAEDHIDVLGLTLMDDATVLAIAHYFAEQPPAPPTAGEAALIAAGEKIYTRGDAKRGIAPCAVCHGQNAAGFWIFPRLAGQHAEYVERQLRAIQSSLRNSPVMHGIVKDMTPEDVQAVATFVQSK